MTRLKPNAGLVLAGGGARGAYEVGVMNGVANVLRDAGISESPFRIFTGTSVGAINATFLAAHSDRPDLGAVKLREIWLSLQWSQQLSFTWRRVFSTFRSGGGAQSPAILDASALEALICDSIPWDKLPELVADGHLHALVVAALQIYSGRTTLFAQLSEECMFKPSKDPRRVLSETSIDAKHVLASSAIPFLFSPQQIDGRWYCDGSIRFNTPISPAIRCGAERLMVIGVRNMQPAMVGDFAEPPPGVGTILGKLLNALLLDPVHYDLQVLKRFNRFIEVTRSVLGEADQLALDKVFRETRGNRYRNIELLTFSPSKDLGQLAAELLLNKPSRFGRSMTSRWLFKRLAREDAVWEHDLASYLLFDSEYLDRLVTLGCEDAMTRREEIIDFLTAP